MAEQLSIDRIYGGGSLNGPTPTKVQISPDGERVTFLRAKADDQTTYDLWEYNVKARNDPAVARFEKARARRGDN